LKRIIVLGATSSIAQHVLQLLAEEGHELLLVARHAERLATIAADLRLRGASRVLSFVADLSDLTTHSQLFRFAVDEFRDFDTVLLTYGTMQDQNECRVSLEKSVAEWNTNFVSAAALLTVFATELKRRNCGCLAVVTSVAGDRGRGSNYVYGSAKGALSLYLQGLRNHLHKSNVRVITIKPGPVNTRMTAHLASSSKFASPSRVASDIVRALHKPRDIVYTPWYWRHIMGVIKAIPESIFKRLPL
jgi:decaprenylphospho-beta-D-erythro-pentofuranosid-2-ulose 2-reductase